ncbi:FT-interacting protein 1-like [Canna indica]|uniref:FT-interacting protein 1-like n=1 Tax=Canna indica TaxID=4628 RepID=A0AAQ3K9I6_9LILI|nr:FT-interacting protein 1-like [Canna indica]
MATSGSARTPWSMTSTQVGPPAKPKLPKIHYTHPLPLLQQELLRNHAVEIVAARLTRMEPPLQKEAVMWMSDAKAHLWSMRRTKANLELQRIISVFSHVIAVDRLRQVVLKIQMAVGDVATQGEGAPAAFVEGYAGHDDAYGVLPHRDNAHDLES